MTQEQKRTRRQTIIAALRCGLSVQTLADRHGISSEYVNKLGLHAGITDPRIIRKRENRLRQQKKAEAARRSESRAKRIANHNSVVEKWSGRCDWSKQDIELAEELGLSRERVRQIQLYIEKPKSQNNRRRRNRIA